MQVKLTVIDQMLGTISSLATVKQICYKLLLNQKVNFRHHKIISRSHTLSPVYNNRFPKFNDSLLIGNCLDSQTDAEPTEHCM
jgi:hypothetical protein